MIPDVITREHVLLALAEIDANGVPSERESTVWLLKHGGKTYPPKYVISIAGKYALGHEHRHEEFSGGPRTNNFLEKRGFEIIGKPGMKAFSWTIADGDTATKVLDKSAFLHRGTGIPKEIRSFFLDRDLAPGERFNVTLSVDGKAYLAHIAMESQGTSRTRLFWDSQFASLLHSSYPFRLQQYQQDQEPNNQIVMRLERIEGFQSYMVAFGAELPDSDIALDIEAERIEDVGPRIEGGVKEYYGKRYERDAVNRRNAIEYHGLTCKACGFNFEQVYGERGSGYIEVHHVKPISTEHQAQMIDPKVDLVTVCSNCHRIIHRDPNHILTVNDLKAIMLKIAGARSNDY